MNFSFKFSSGFGGGLPDILEINARVSATLNGSFTSLQTKTEATHHSLLLCLPSQGTELTATVLHVLVLHVCEFLDSLCRLRHAVI